MRSLLVVVGLAGCSSFVPTDARHRFLSETLEEPEDVMLKTADLHTNLLREPPMTIKLDNRYKFTGLGELVSQLIDHHTTMGSVGSSGTMARQKLLNYHNSQYFGEIKIGTPGRRFVVVSCQFNCTEAEHLQIPFNFRFLILVPQTFGFPQRNARSKRHLVIYLASNLPLYVYAEEDAPPTKNSTPNIPAPFPPYGR